jgi:hypothetical protein
MAKFDLFHNLSVKPAFNFQAISSSTTTNGATIDTAGFYSLTFAIQSGTLTDGAYAITMFHGDEADMSDEVAVPSDFILGSLADAGFAASDDNETHRVGYAGKKRYVRIKVVSTSVSTGGSLGAIALLADPASAPVA